TNTVPAGLTIVDAAGGTINGQIVTWNIGSLASGGWNSFTLTLAPPAAGGTFTNIAASSGTTYDPVTTNNNGTAAGGSVTTVVAPLNVAPTLTAISNQTINESAGQQTVNLAGITAGGGVSQMLTITATSSDPGLVPNPTVTYTSPNSTGSLSYTPVAYSNGVVTITVVVQDNGGTANGGVDRTTNTFTITVNPVNNPPSFTKGGNQTVNEDAGAQSASNWATAISPGPPNESSQTVTFHLSNNNNALFSAQPAVSSAGTLTYTPAANANGSATVTIYAQDNGGTSNGGVDVSATDNLTITVNPVNDPPSFTLLTNNVVVAGGAQSLPQVTNISAGPANESGQLVTFLVGNNNNGLFSVQPAIRTNGTLTFTPADNMVGTATVTVYAQDDGGTANGGVDTSAAQTFTVTVTGLGRKLVFTTQPVSTNAGSILANVVVQIQNVAGDNVASNNVPITLTVNTGSFAAGTVTRNTDASGKATFNDLQINLAGGYTLTAAASGIGAGLASTNSSAFSITAVAASKLAFTTQPGGGTGGTAWSQQPEVTLQDQYGNTVTGTAQNITLAIQNNAGGGTLSGTTSVVVNTSTGLAAFSGLSINRGGNGYKLTATGNTVSTIPGVVTSDEFNVMSADSLTVGRAWGTYLRIPVDAVLAKITGGLSPHTLSSVTSRVGGDYVQIRGAEILFAPVGNTTSILDYTFTDSSSPALAASSTITVAVTNAIGSVNSIHSTSNGQITIEFLGVPNFTYIVQRASPDAISTWYDLDGTGGTENEHGTIDSTHTAPASGVWSFTDISPPIPSAYYRLRQKP
ncbi:MAG: Ig-like domain-containing protein, partial [Verrucomicrobia bacterium]|nr:Ig-like domain-containing protein [Verrucomicrobiota bacterium]